MSDKKEVSAVQKFGGIALVLGVIITLAFVFGQLNKGKESRSSTATSSTTQATTQAGGSISVSTPTVTIKTPLVSSCTPFSTQETGCEIESSGSGWIHRAQGADTGLRACWSPRLNAKHEDGTPVFSRIEYLDANGAVQIYDPAKQLGAVTAYNFYPTRKMILNYNLAAACRSSDAPTTNAEVVSETQTTDHSSESLAQERTVEDTYRPL